MNGESNHHFPYLEDTFLGNLGTEKMREYETGEFDQY